MDDTNVKVSIIIPVFNCGNTLEFKILAKALSRQTETEIEVILCDDGSTDETPRIITELESKDSRFRSVLNEHSGVSAARNSGLELARGEWVAFVDSDDMVTETYISDFLNRVTDDVDLIFCSYLIATVNETKIKMFSSARYIGKESIAVAFEDTKLLERCSPWGKLFRRDVIERNGLRFDESLSHSEDRHFIYRFLLYTGGIATVPSIGYIYNCFSSSSLKHRLYPVEDLIHRQTLLYEAAVEVCKKYSIPPSANYSFVINLLNLYRDAIYKISLSHDRRKRVEKNQTRFFNSVISEASRSYYQADSRICKLIHDDGDLNLLLQGDFDKFNNKQIKIRRKLRMSRLIMKVILNRTGNGRGEFTKLINKLN